MDPSETAFQSFVVKVWLEETDPGRARWRGRVTHIPSHEQRHVKHLDEITDFMVPYLEAAGVRPSLCWWMRRWLSRRAR